MMTSCDRMHPDVVRMLHHFQRMPRMTRLSTRQFATRFAQTARTGFGESIAGRGLATVATVLAQLVFELLDTRFQVSDQLNELVG